MLQYSWSLTIKVICSSLSFLLMKTRQHYTLTCRKANWNWELPPQLQYDPATLNILSTPPTYSHTKAAATPFLKLKYYAASVYKRLGKHKVGVDFCFPSTSGRLAYLIIFMAWYRWSKLNQAENKKQELKNELITTTDENPASSEIYSLKGKKGTPVKQTRTWSTLIQQQDLPLPPMHEIFGSASVLHHLCIFTSHVECSWLAWGQNKEVQLPRTLTLDLLISATPCKANFSSLPIYRITP